VSVLDFSAERSQDMGGKVPRYGGKGPKIWGERSQDMGKGPKIWGSPKSLEMFIFLKGPKIWAKVPRYGLISSNLLNLLYFP
jgi:hypothetical protein